MHHREDILAAIRAEVVARALRDGPRASTLSFDGCRHYLTALGGAWEVHFELEQLGAGEVIGVGSMWAPTRPGNPLQASEVIVSGRVDDRGMATLTLAPAMPGGRGPVTLLVRMVTRSDGQDPIVGEVIEVHGLPR